MLSAFISSLRTADLRRKILFTLGVVVLYRAGAALPSPGVNYPNVQKCIEQVSGGDAAQVYSLINLFSGGALLHLTVFAVGVMPYITASIIVQLLMFAQRPQGTDSPSSRGNVARVLAGTRMLWVRYQKGDSQGGLMFAVEDNNGDGVLSERWMKPTGVQTAMTVAAQRDAGLPVVRADPAFLFGASQAN